MVSKGCSAFLAHLRDDTSKVPSVESISIVREFWDVLPADLPGMTPDRDIDFCIDLEPEKLAKLYVFEIVLLNGVPLSIISDRDGQSDRTIQVLEDMLRACVIEFANHWDKFLPLAEFLCNNIYHSSIDMAQFEVLYGRRCRFPIGWFDAFEVRPWGTNLLRESLEKVKFVQENLLVAQSRLKESANRKVRELEFMEGEYVLMKVSPTKGVMRFGKRGKISKRYIGPFEVLKRMGEVAYELALPSGLSGVHPVFHLSMLKKYHGDGNYIIHWYSVLLDDNLSYDEELIDILDREVRKLRSKEIAYIKVQWKNRPVVDSILESQTDMHERYPHLFTNLGFKPTRATMGKKHFWKCLGGTDFCFCCGTYDRKVRYCPTIAARGTDKDKVPRNASDVGAKKKNHLHVLEAKGANSNNDAAKLMFFLFTFDGFLIRGEYDE
ncbi:uncharacterized protein [Solanum lycopersicum]|uniref:uncharacterized protein n=1 Tax=Solanum lycopersicum TaxID=4081 RepID=UPI0037488BE4